MKKRLLDFLCCPECRQNIDLTVFEESGGEIVSGLLSCDRHFFPIAGGIPRMLPSSLKDYWGAIESKIPTPMPQKVKELIANKQFATAGKYDTATKANFSSEWDHHEIGDQTWTMELKDRVQWYFLDSIKVPKADLKDRILLDAGCGNGSQSVAYTEFGLEVLAVDLSTGLEKGYAYRGKHVGANPDKVHFVNADLQKPPFRNETVDIVHSAGVLHHTPNTEKTFHALRPLLRSGGTFYVWLYKYEKIVTPIVNSIRAVTTRIPMPVFSLLADGMSFPFIGFCWAVDKLGIRKYVVPSRREAALALHDIFGAPYAHYHSFEEVSEWYKSVGINEIWPCNDDRRGFGVCGRISGK